MPLFADLMRIAPPTGTWGRALPRAGHVIHTSPLAASGLASLRGFNIARSTPTICGRWRGCIAWAPATSARADRLSPNAQYPEVGPFPCMQLEEPARLRLRGGRLRLLQRPAGRWRRTTTRTRTARYTWIIWKHRSCTCPVPLGYCAHQLEGLGDDNRCVRRDRWGASCARVGESVIGELRSTIGALADNLRNELENTASSITDSFANLTGTASGPGSTAGVHPDRVQPAGVRGLRGPQPGGAGRCRGSRPGGPGGLFVTTGPSAVGTPVVRGGSDAGAADGWRGYSRCRCAAPAWAGWCPLSDRACGVDGLDSSVVDGLIRVESGGNPWALHVGIGRGYAFYPRDGGAKRGGSWRCRWP